MNWFQISVIVLLIINQVYLAYLHGKPKEGDHNFWNSTIGLGILVLLLYFGGFWETSP